MFSLSPLDWIKENLVIIAISLIALLGGYFYGHSSGYGEAKAKGDAAIAQLRGEYDKTYAKAVNTAATKLIAEIKRGNALASELATTQQQLADVQNLLQKKVSYVTTVYKTSPAATPQPIPRAVFTRGYVRLLNTAFGADRTACVSSTSTSSNDAVTEATASVETGLCGDDLLDSGISQADLLSWAIDTGTQCQQERAQLIQLIQLETPHD